MMCVRMHDIVDVGFLARFLIYISLSSRLRGRRENKSIKQAVADKKA